MTTHRSVLGSYRFYSFQYLEEEIEYIKLKYPHNDIERKEYWHVRGSNLALKIARKEYWHGRAYNLALNMALKGIVWRQCFQFV